MSNLKCSLFYLALPTESLGYTKLIAVSPYVRLMFECFSRESLGSTTLMHAARNVQPTFFSSTYRISEFRYTYKFATLSAAYICMLYLQNYTALVGAPPYGQPMFVSSA